MGGELGTILRGYRRASALTQQQLADMLGYDRTYISMIESGRRSVADRGTLAHIAGTLAIPPRVLGVAGPGDADFAAMLALWPPNPNELLMTALTFSLRAALGT